MVVRLCNWIRTHVYHRLSQLRKRGICTPQTGSQCKTSDMLADASNGEKSRLYPRFAATTWDYKINQ
jgi:hypothetical protein